jgi:sacsin
MANELSKQFQAPMVAWAAVAADVTTYQKQLCTVQGAAGDTAIATAPAHLTSGAAAVAAAVATSDGDSAGRAFCFLPLPAFTCLPVHINGYFELSSNRRDVWHGADMAGAGR